MLTRKLSLYAAAFLATALLLASCGGGSGGSDAPIVNNPPPDQAQGTVGIVITDADSDQFDQILATITSIDLLGEDGPANIFSGRQVIDLKQLADYSELFAIADVDTGIYSKIRLILADLELVKLNDDGTVDYSVHPKLTGNGKMDLNPRREFVVTDNSNLLIEMDFDAQKSIKYHQSGNGKWHFRPVIFVRVLDDVGPGRLSRIYGRIGEVDYDLGRFELCQKELMSDRDDVDDFDEEHCVEVVTSADTGIFAPSGDPTDFGAIMSGEFATAIGFISSREDKMSLLARKDSDDDDDDDDSDDDSDDDRSGRDDDDDDGEDFDHDHFTLDAVVVELGEAGTFARLKGTAQSDVDAGRDFDLLLAPGQGFGEGSMVTARLQDGSKIYSRNGVRLGDDAISDGVMGLFDGVLMLANDAPDVLKTALAILDIDADGEEVLRGEILTAGDDRRLMLATDTGDQCVDVPLRTDIFLVRLVEGRLISDRGSYADLQPGLTIDVYGEPDNGCFIADTIIADQTEDAPPPAENQPPVADAGPDQAVQTGTGVQLDGTGSSDPDGDAITYSWSLTVPDGSAANLAAADTSMPSFIPDVDGDYVATLVVNDGELDSAPDTVTVTASAEPPANQAPIADAGPNQEVDTGTGVTLDGSGSSDPDGDTITYGWSLTVPDGSSAALGGADTASPSFTPDVDGDYVATLVVNDGELDSDPDSVTVTASSIPPPANQAPIADAGPNQEVETGTGVTLDGSGSSDPDGDTITYSWSLTVPDGSSATLSGADTASPSFTPDVDGDYVATLVVNDGELDSDPDSVTVTASTTPVIDGFALYAEFCEACHDPIAESEKRGASAAEIQGAIDQNKGGMGFLDFLTPDDVQAISDALNTP